jgi:hypothetical protein
MPLAWSVRIFLLISTFFLQPCASYMVRPGRQKTTSKILVTTIIFSCRSTLFLKSKTPDLCVKGCIHFLFNLLKKIKALQQTYKPKPPNKMKALPTSKTMEGKQDVVP